MTLRITTDQLRKLVAQQDLKELRCPYAGCDSTGPFKVTFHVDAQCYLHNGEVRKLTTVISDGLITVYCPNDHVLYNWDETRGDDTVQGLIEELIAHSLPT